MLSELARLMQDQREHPWDYDPCPYCVNGMVLVETPNNPVQKVQKFSCLKCFQTGKKRVKFPIH